MAFVGQEMHTRANQEASVEGAVGGAGGGASRAGGGVNRKGGGAGGASSGKGRRLTFHRFSIPTIRIRPAEERFDSNLESERILQWASALSTSTGGSSQTRSRNPTSTPTSSSKLRFECQQRKIILGIFLAMVAAVTLVTATQLYKTAILPEHNYQAPFFLAYLSTSWIMVVYPAFLLGRVIGTKGKLSLKETFRDDVSVYSEDGITFRPLKVILKVVCFSLLWVITTYVYLRALHMKPCTDVITLFATNSSFVYLLSWILLHKQFMGIRIVAILLAMTGICMVTYMEGGFSNNSLWGAILAVTSTAGAASYKVFFKKIAGDATLGQVSLFLSCLSLFSTLTLWPILLLLYFTHAEPIDFGHVPWDLICGSAGSAFVLTFILNHGISWTYPVILQLSFVIPIPLSVVVDLFWRDEVFGGMQIAATVIITLSTPLNMLPEDWPRCVTQAFNIKPRQNTNTQSRAILSPRQTLRSTAC